MKEINLDQARKLSSLMRFSRDNQAENPENQSDAKKLSKQLLEDSLLVTEKITPRIYDTVCKVTKNLYVENDILEVFIVASNEMNASVFSAHPEHCALILNSEIIEKLDEKELSFIIGHEIGHFLLDHVRQKNENNNAESLRQKRAQEISCDRIGLWACGDINIALNSLIKLTSGLSQRHLGLDSMALLSQMKKIEKESVFDRSNSTHPPWYIRAFSLFHFSLSDFFIQKNLEFYREDQIMNINKRIEKKLDEYIDNSNYTLNKIIENYEFWYVVNHSLSDGKLSKSEQELIQEKFGKRKLERLKNILHESAQKDVIELISAKQLDLQDQLKTQLPNEFNKITDKIKEFCFLNLNEKNL